MRKVKYLIIAVFAVLLMGIAVAPIHAQSQDLVTATVDRTNITTDDLLTLTVAVEAAAGDPSQPVLPPLEGFNVLSSSRGTQMTIINGEMSVQTTYQYRLQPIQPGNLVIGPISITVNGNVFNTEPIDVNVSQGTGVPQPANPPSLFPGLSNFPNFPNFPALPNFPSLGSQAAAPSNPTVPVDPAPVPADLVGQDYFIEAVVDNSKPYQGQQVTYTLRFYQAVDGLGQTEYQPPTFTGFWSEQIPEQGQYAIQAAGRDYRVTVVNTILFPTVVGEVTIEPATLNVPGDFFSRGARLSTQPLSLEVQPLPEGAPPSFQGAVGQYEIQAEVDSPRVMVNDTLTWQIRIAGSGNIENLADPLWPEQAEWRAFDSEAMVETAIEDGQVVGTRTYDRVLVPTVAGELTLPSINYSYFDPQLAQYMTISTDPITIAVTPDGNSGNLAPAMPAADDGTISAPAAGIVPDLRSIKEAPDRWHISKEPLTQQAGFWLLWILPISLLVGHFSLNLWQQKRTDNASTRRSQQAAKRANQALRQTRKNSDEGYGAAGQILLTYLSEKMNQPVSGLTQADLAQLLQERGLAPDLVDRVQHCLTISEMGRFAPAGAFSSNGDLLTETKQVIDELDKSL
jgi:hypothetical protein